MNLLENAMSALSSFLPQAAPQNEGRNSQAEVQANSAANFKANIEARRTELSKLSEAGNPIQGASIDHAINNLMPSLMPNLLEKVTVPGSKLYFLFVQGLKERNVDKVAEAFTLLRKSAPVLLTEIINFLEKIVTEFFALQTRAQHATSEENELSTIQPNTTTTQEQTINPMQLLQQFGLGNLVGAAKPEAPKTVVEAKTPETLSQANDVMKALLGQLGQMPQAQTVKV